MLKTFLTMVANDDDNLNDLKGTPYLRALSMGKTSFAPELPDTEARAPFFLPRNPLNLYRAANKPSLAFTRKALIH